MEVLLRKINGKENIKITEIGDNTECEYRLGKGLIGKKTFKEDFIEKMKSILNNGYELAKITNFEKDIKFQEIEYFMRMLKELKLKDIGIYKIDDIEELIGVEIETDNFKDIIVIRKDYNPILYNSLGRISLYDSIETTKEKMEDGREMVKIKFKDNFVREKIKDNFLEELREKEIYKIDKEDEFLFL